MDSRPPATTEDLYAAMADVDAWYGQAMEVVARYEGQGRETQLEEDLEAMLPNLAQRFERVEAVFDSHIASVPADVPRALVYIRSLRKALTEWRATNVTLTATAGDAAEAAMKDSRDAIEPKAAHEAAVIARVREATRDVTGMATLRLRRMIGRLDEKYGTTGGE